jgi:hypothetical protein
VRSFQRTLCSSSCLTRTVAAVAVVPHTIGCQSIARRVWLKHDQKPSLDHFPILSGTAPSASPSGRPPAPSPRRGLRRRRHSPLLDKTGTTAFRPRRSAISAPVLERYLGIVEPRRVQKSHLTVQSVQDHLTGSPSALAARRSETEQQTTRNNESTMLMLKVAKDWTFRVVHFSHRNGQL